VIRYRNEEIINDTEKILREILNEISSPQTPLQNGEGLKKPLPFSSMEKGPGDEDTN